MKKQIFVKLHTHDPKCKYPCHKEPGGVFRLEDLVPEGMCPDAYFAAYPYCLSLMYGAKFKFMEDSNTVSFQCPSPAKPVIMLARRIRLGRKKHRFTVTVTGVLDLKNKVKNTCRCRMKVGDTFEFNHMGQCPEICPAGFMHLFPYITTLARGGTPPWPTSNNSYLVHCPDEKINVCYEITCSESHAAR